MNGEIPSVPITTLAGVSSLVDLLPEMPLPSPLPQTLSNKSLLFHPRVAEEAQRLLIVNDDNLVSQLVHCLSQTSSKHIDLKDQISDVTLDHQNSPSLLGGILLRKPDVFKGKYVRDDHIQHSPPNLQLIQGSQQNQLLNSSQNQPPLLPPSSPSQQILQIPQAQQSIQLAQSLQLSQQSLQLQQSSQLQLHPQLTTPQLHSSSPQLLHQPPQIQLDQLIQIPLQQQQPLSHNEVQHLHHSAFGHLSQHPPLSLSQSSPPHSQPEIHHHQQQQQQLPPRLPEEVSNPPLEPSPLQAPVLPPPLQPPVLPPPLQAPVLPPPLQAPVIPPPLQSPVLPPPLQSPVLPPPLQAPVLPPPLQAPVLPPPLQAPVLPPPLQAPISIPIPVSQSPQIHPFSQNHLQVDQEQAQVQQAPKLPRHEKTDRSSSINANKMESKFTPMRLPQVQITPLDPSQLQQYGHLFQPLEQQMRPQHLPPQHLQPQPLQPQPLLPQPVLPQPLLPENLPSQPAPIMPTSSGGDPVVDSPAPTPKTEEPETNPKQRKPSVGLPFVKLTPLPATVNNRTDVFKSKQVKQEPPPPPIEPMDISPKKKIRRVERMLVPVLEKLEVKVNKVSENNTTYSRFLKMMDIVLENVDDFDRNDMDVEEDENVPSELLIPKHQLSELCSEAAKLKALGAMETMPSEKIVRLLSILEKNIRDGSKVSPLADADDNEEESRLWLELTMESITRGVLACLTSLHILTSQNMPKKVYLEDLIDRMVMFTKFQLQNTIFPSFDPVYRIDKKGKDGFSSSKKKRAHAREVREKNMVSFYNKMHEVVGLLAELLNVQVLTDTTVLHLSTLGVSPFFVENVSELQLSALKLVTGIFAQYEKHRRLLLDDILASIARLPSSKRSLRTFKLSSSDDCIQMLTALVLQLIQCVTSLPDNLGSKLSCVNSENDDSIKSKTEQDLLIRTKFDHAMRTAGSFLTVFLSKCGSKSDECDYKLLFENFVQDLLSTVNKPQWPAAELLLSLLGTLLVKNLTNKSCEVSLRVASLEYLGVAASRLRKDAVSSHLRMDTIDRIIADIKAEEDQYGEHKDMSNDKDVIDDEEEKTRFLQRLLLDYLAVHGQNDPALMHARHFYISSWWKTAASDISNRMINNNSKAQKPNRAKKRKKKKGESSEEESEVEVSDNDDENGKELEINTKVMELSEKRKDFLVSKIRPFNDPLTARKTKVVQTFVDYQSAELITRYLASQRPFSASFDSFLKRILSVSTEQTVAIRTKALRCLTMVVEADSSVLARSDMQMWVGNSFLDQSTAVREAAVDLVGKYVLSCHDLIEKYYETLSERILDTGVSVRKRVIKILRDICVECPKFPKIPEICVKMIRRVNDEDGIRKLVMEVFQNMWFTPVKDDPLDTEALLRKVSHITEVVASCEKIGLDFFEQLLLSLFKPKDDKEDVREKQANQEPPKAVLLASKQIVNCLVEHVLRLEESSNSMNSRFVACVATLYLFAKIRPQLLVNHAITLEGYLSLRCQNQAEVHAVANIGNILELVVPLLVNPSESFLGQLEEDCVKLILKNEKSVIDSCLACLGAVVNKITRNYSLIRDVFRRFQVVLVNQTNLLRANFNWNSTSEPGSATEPRPQENRPLLRRSVYTIGLFLRYFDFSSPEIYGDFPPDIVHQVFSHLMFILQMPQEDMKYFSLQALGNLCIRHYNFMLETDLKNTYQQLLTTFAETKLKVQALNNIQLYLVEEELRMIKQDQEWNKIGKLENIKEMGDVTSGMASTIVQIYLKQILEAFLHSQITVRLAAVRVIQLVLQQGLVHPIQIVPYLICMSTDPEGSVSTTADKQLQEMEKKHPQFLQSQVLNGIRLSLQLQRILNGYTGLVIPGHAMPINANAVEDGKEDQKLPVVRGYRTRPKEAASALNGFLYSLLRSTKPQRRAVALSLLKQFDDSKNQLSDLLYYADNLAYFPYQVVDEPLFIIHHVDIVISVTGSNLLQAFKESLIPVHLPPKPNDGGEENSMSVDDPMSMIPPVVTPAPITDIMEDDEDEDPESLVKRVPSDTKTLEECIISSQGCLLLLMLKQHLKDTYGITDTRISGYSPSDATKAYERPVNRRNTQSFEPKCTIANLHEPPSGATPESRLHLVEQYLHFKQLMLRIDPEEGDEDGETKPAKAVKIDQSLFQYPKSRAPTGRDKGIPPSSTSGSSSLDGSPIKNSTNSTNVNNPQFSCVSQPTNSTPVAKVDPIVRVPKLTIVPLKFPGAEPQHKEKKIHHHKEHKVKDHNHHHKYKKSKHKKKKRYAVSDDDDSDNPDSDPDFHL